MCAGGNQERVVTCVWRNAGSPIFVEHKIMSLEYQLYFLMQLNLNTLIWMDSFLSKDELIFQHQPSKP